MAKKNFVALDLGAESGRGIAGTLSGKKLTLEVLNRFQNKPVNILGTYHWNILFLFQEMKEALKAYRSKYGSDLAGIGVDTWGVDFGLLGRDGKLLENPVIYRDSRCDGMMEAAFKKVPKMDIYNATGIQFMQINSLYQFLSLSMKRKELLKSADEFLFMPDLFNYFFTGERVAEFTMASTSQMHDPNKMDWARGMLKKLNIPTDILPRVILPGKKIGGLLPSICKETGIGKTNIYSTGCHDTASAVAAVPVSGKEDWAYLSCGTWSLMGLELDKPLISEASLSANFTNEGGVYGTTRFLKNIMGLWILQRCRAKWEEEAGSKLHYGDIAKEAERAKSLRMFINPNDNAFLNPPDMPKAIMDYLKKTKQPLPKSRGEMARCVIESLAMAYRMTLDNINNITGRNIKVLHMVGGGTQNELLCRCSANAMGIPAVAGPIEATATGNILIQAIAAGYVKDLTEAREIVRNSFDVKVYEPKDRACWEEAYGRFLGLVKTTKESI